MEARIPRTYQRSRPHRSGHARWLGRIVVVAGVMLRPAGSLAQVRGGPSESPLILGDAYRALEAQSPRLEAARLQAMAAAERVRPASTLPDPQLQIGILNRNLPGFGLQDPLGMTTIGVMQMLPLAGTLGLAGGVARAQAAATQERAVDLTWDLRSRVAMVFYELFAIDRALEVAISTQLLLRDIAKTAETMYSVGEGRQADVLRAQVELARMSEEITRMQAMREAQAARLNALLDQPLGTPVPSPALPRYPDTLPSLDSLQRVALAERPMLHAGASDLEAAEQAARLARREIWPDLQLGVEYGQRPMDGGTDRMISFTFGVSVPLFAGRRQLPMRREADAMRLMASADLEAMPAETSGRLGELYAEVARARSLVGLYHTTIIPQADATFASALSAYRVGSVDFMTLLDDQMTVNRYRQDLFQLQAEEGKALAEMEMLLGQQLFDAQTTAESNSTGDTK